MLNVSSVHALLDTMDGYDVLRLHMDHAARRGWRVMLRCARSVVDARTERLAWAGVAGGGGGGGGDDGLPRLHLPLGLLGAERTPLLRLLSVEGADLRGDVDVGAAVCALGPRLRTLRLRGVVLGERAEAVALALGSLVSLTELDLGCTEFAGASVRALARSLGALSSLRVLCIASPAYPFEYVGVGVSVVAALGGLSGLRELDLGGAQLVDGGEALAAALSALTGLVRLDLAEVLALAAAGQPGSSAAARVLVCGALSALTGLRELAIDGLLDGGGDATLAALAASLGAMPGLLSLSARFVGDVNGVTLPPETEGLCRALAPLARLRALRLDGMLYRERRGAGASLAAAVRGMRDLRVLTLAAPGRAHVPSEAAAAVVGALASGPPPPLVELDLGGSAAGGRIACMDALAGLPARVLGGLRALILPCTCLGREGAARLAPALARMPGLRALDLDDNCLGAAGAVAELAPALARLARLEALSLCYNGLGADALAALAPCLAAMTSLRALKLFSNGIDGARAADALATALESMPALDALVVNRAEAAVLRLLRTPAGLAITSYGSAHIFDGNPVTRTFDPETGGWQLEYRHDSRRTS
jgi:hypothetical protein